MKTSQATRGLREVAQGKQRQRKRKVKESQKPKEAEEAKNQKSLWLTTVTKEAPSSEVRRPRQ